MNKPITSISEIIRTRIRSFVGGPDHNNEEKRQRIFFAFIMLVSILMVFSYGFHHVIKGNSTQGLFLLIIGVIQIISLLSLRHLRNALIIYRINVIIFGCWLLFIMIIGIGGGAGILWMFLFPPIIFILLGKKEGLLFSIIPLFLSLFFLFDPYSIIGTYPYRTGIKTRFPVIYSLFVIMGYIVRSVLQRYEEGMEKEQLKLQSEIKVRIETEEELKKYHDHLEELVRKRTSELTSANEKLMSEVEGRKRTEVALREAYDIINRSPAVAFLWKNEGGWPVEFVSDNVELLFGYTAVQFISGKVDYASTVHPDDLERVAKEVLRFSEEEGRERFTHEPYRIVTKEGTVKWIDDRTYIRRDEKGRITHYQGIVEDITDRKRAEEALHKSEERYRDLFNSINDFIYAHDLEGHFLSINRAAVQTLGYSPDEFIGRSVSDFMLPEYRQAFQEEYLPQVKSQGFFNGIFVQLDKSGRKHYIEYRNNLVRKEREEPYVSGVGRDITEKIEAEKEVKKLEKQVQYAQRMEAIGTLAGGIAHDFNNLLMAIQGNASLVLLGVDSGHPHYERLKNIEQYVQSGSDLTRQLLGFARRGKYETKPTDLNELIKRSSEMFGRTQKGITIYSKYQEGLWTAEVDQGQMEQVLLNLYVNAWQAMPVGGGLYLETANITLEERYVKPHGLEPGKYIKISVTDTGVGMDKATRERVFDPFFTTKEMGRGTGLGLASAYGIIKNHGGIINVYSEKGEGTTFNIYLPASEKVVLREKEVADEILRGTGTVLLVDDEEMVREVGKEILKTLGYEVFLANNGREAVDVYGANRDRIEMVILDLVMPEMSGGETFDRLRAINPTIKVLLSSGYSVNGQAQKILDRGCNGFIQKPFTIKALSVKLREVLDKE